MNNIENMRDLDDAKSQPRALLFCYVGWSIQARHAEVRFRKLLQWWAARHPDRPLPGYRIDLTEQQGELWDTFREWLSSQGIRREMIGALTTGGYGSLLWLRNNAIVDITVNFGEPSPDKAPQSEIEKQAESNFGSTISN